MKKNVIRAVILSGALLGANPITAFAAEPGSYIYAGANVNVRSVPDGDVIGNFPYNAQGVLLEEDEYGWYKIQSGDVIGYVASQYCGDEPFAKGYTKATVNSNGLKVRQTKDENSNVLDIIDQNASIEVTEAYDQSAWVSVVTDDNKYGYVSADYVTLNTYYPTATKISYVVSNEQATTTENTTGEVSNIDDVVEMTPTYVEPEETYDYETQAEPTEDYSYEPELETENVEGVYQEETSYENEESYEEEAPEEEEPSYEEVNEEPSYEEETNEEPVYEEEQQEEEEVNEEPSYEEDTDTAEEPSYEEPTVSDSSTGASIAATASNYVGCSYVWGATGPDSFDCSGLVSYVFSSYGISVPRTAADQYYGGTQIDVSTAVSTPGALIFYHGLGHVAISLGDGSVVHASNSDTGVIISDAYYSTPDGAAVYF